MMEQQPAITATVPFLAVSDMESSLRFYVDGLGFGITHSWTPRGRIEWCALKRDAGMLMLQQPSGDEQHPGLPEGKRGLGVSIFFICEDALPVYRELVTKGITVAEPFVGNNMWVISLLDPDGYSIEFESATDVPEQTTYSDWIKQNA
ncbi:MAG: VOC family protein [Chitinophagaceae bacterium]